MDGQPSGDDLPGLRLVTVPDTGPPFDGDRLASAIATSAALEAGWPEADDPGRANWPRAGNPGLSRVPEGAGMARPDACGEWPRQFARLLAEALAGARPVRQVLPWTSERARIQLRRLTPLFSSGQRPRVLRVILTRPAREVIEMTVIVVVGSRTRALAVRLEQAAPGHQTGPAGHGGQAGHAGPDGADRPAGPPAAAAFRWICTDIEAA